MQASRIGRLGAGHVLIMGATPNFVAVSVLALTEGGAPLLASLVVVASLFYLALAIWLPLLRRIITPVVSGTVLMLIAVTVLPVALDRVQETPVDAPGATGPTVALVTLIVIVGLALRVSGAWRLWSPLIGIGVGLRGRRPLRGLRRAARGRRALGGHSRQRLPRIRPVVRRRLLGAAAGIRGVITLVGGIKNIGDSVAIQGASRRRPRVTDFRLVQGSLNTNGLGILLSGVAGTPPTTVYSSTSVSLTSLTGVAARRVGYVIGALLLVLALFPKLTAVLLTIPSPVMGAYLLTAIGLLFVGGIRTVVQDGLDAQKALVVGIGFSVGAGVEQQTIFADLLGGTWGALLDNGMLAGTVATVLMILFLNLTSRRRGGRLEVKLHASSLPAIDTVRAGGRIPDRLERGRDRSAVLRCGGDADEPAGDGRGAGGR